MATLVLTTVGAIVGGPIGAAVGAAIGNSIDQSIFAPKGRSGPRLDDLAVQSSAYGAPIPHIFGTTRATGNIIWSRGLKETPQSSGGGKRSGGRTTTYSYSSSFAVAVSGRRIAGIGRIWGDGKLLRGASGELTADGRLRIYTGDETQIADPLIVAAEGITGAPAYRGVAYVVFEDLQLGDFANRIPNLSFEVIADSSPPSVGAIISALCGATGNAPVVTGLSMQVPGYAAARNAPLSTWITSLSALSPVRIGSSGQRLELSDSSIETGLHLTTRSIVAAGGAHASETRTAVAKTAGAVTVGFLDPARDYLPGLQRAFRADGNPGEDHFELPGVLSAAAAKRTAQDILQRRWIARETARRRLGYRAIGLAPGDRLRTEDGRPWEVRRTTIEGMSVEIEMDPVNAAVPGPVDADGGRANVEPDLPQGDTVFHVIELPPLGSELPALPRLWIAAGGTGAGWRRAEILLSRDDGATWSSAGVASGNAVIGQTVGALGNADATRWDETNTVDVELVSDAMWLESRARLSVLAGANIALVGNELIQFRSAELIAPRRFRLGGLRRGYRATEQATGGHVGGERFVLFPADSGPFAVDQPVEAIGGRIMVRLVAPNRSFADSPETIHTLMGRSLRPLSPVHVDARLRPDGAIAISWVRRSRAGFGWIDGADAAIAEDGETYRLRCISSGGAYSAVVVSPFAVLDSAAQLASFGVLPATLRIEVAQISGLVGEGGLAVHDALFIR